MIRRGLSTLLLFFALALPHAAYALAVDVSSPAISVTTGFTGATVTVFGEQDRVGDVAVVVEGPPISLNVAQKSPVAGLWAVTGQRRFVGMPAYYAMASTTPVPALAAPDVLRQNRIGLTSFVSVAADESAPFAAALVRHMSERGLYMQEAEPLTRITPHMFKAAFTLPATVTPGAYTVTAYLVKDGQVVESAKAAFEVTPAGMSATLRGFASHARLLYGLSCVAMAVLAGWLATVLLKRE